MQPDPPFDPHISMVKRTAEPDARLPVTSSVPEEIPAKQEGLFREVLTLLQEARLSFAVAGAAALQEHTGICRYTKDLDLFLSAPEASKALLLLHEHGFKTEVRDPVWLAKAHRGEFFVDLITGMSNGVLAVDASWIERLRPARVFGVKTRVLAPEELLVSKLFVARRERFDGADIAHIIYASRGGLEWDRVMLLSGEHWEVLLWALVLFRYVYPGQTDYVPRWVWQELLTRFQREVNSPDLTASFRGSLIDDRMFAIDVNEWGLVSLLEARREQSLLISSPVGQGTANSGARLRRRA
jgi:Nucleotidyl transferase of unknown function (DUF2204)